MSSQLAIRKESDYNAVKTACSKEAALQCKNYAMVQLQRLRMQEAKHVSKDSHRHILMNATRPGLEGLHE
jgi:hypothetical protein